MQSQSIKRVVAGALAATAVIAAVSAPQASANPAPFPQNPPTTSSEALAQYRQLAAQAEQLNEQKLQAEEDLKAKRAELDKANADLETANRDADAANAEKSDHQVEVDQLTDESFVGGSQFAKLSTLLSGTSTQDFLDRSSALEVLANSKNKAMQAYIDAANTATAAQQRANDLKNQAQTASDEAANLLNDLNARSADLDKQISEINAVRARLSAADLAAQRDTGDPVSNVPGSGAAQRAVNFALGKRGSPYVWGATGPEKFDCSGLTQWAFKQAGISIPRTAAQQQSSGTAVSRANLQPGDLVFYGSPAYHVGIYVGDGKMVHAPTTGDVVKVSPLQNNYSGARRYG
ncbi:C40 family peptidase [Amycolatopsis taiwanensis]|uniref:C40 family peptidase n=1 Tax=Amycolatopsis taiwanensis TaxID=342230 RepID=UPI000483BBA6|nr:NlpC/P60 family protein [Amycolatopsis taiwanensis]